MALSPVSLAAYWRLVRDNANFRRLWFAQIVSEIGDWFYSLAIYSLLLELTGLAASVALAVILQVLPQTFAGPMAGVINDRVSRKRVMIVADLGRAAIVLGMLFVRSAETVWLVFPLLLMETVGAAFFEPARSSVIPNITEDEKIILANTLASTTWSFNLAIGATLGGVAAALFGRDTVFVLNMLSFLLSGYLISRMRFVEPHVASSPGFRLRDLVDFTPILEGVRYIRGDRRILFTVFVKFGLGLMGSNNVILPILGERVFPVRFDGLDPQRGSVLGMSLLMASRGAGALLGPFVSGVWAGQRLSRLRTGILIGFLVTASGYLALGMAPSAGLAMAAVVFSHAGGSTVWVFSTTLLQVYTEDRFRGRVFAAELGLLMLTIAFSSYLAGMAIDLGISARAFAMFTGALMLLPACAWSITLRDKGK